MPVFNEHKDVYFYVFWSCHPALKQTVFHVSDGFWVREIGAQKIKKLFFSKIISILFLLILRSQTYLDVPKKPTH